MPFAVTYASVTSGRDKFRFRGRFTRWRAAAFFIRAVNYRQIRTLSVPVVHANTFTLHNVIPKRACNSCIMECAPFGYSLYYCCRSYRRGGRTWSSESSIGTVYITFNTWHYPHPGTSWPEREKERESRSNDDLRISLLRERALTAVTTNSTRAGKTSLRQTTREARGLREKKIGLLEKSRDPNSNPLSSMVTLKFVYTDI